MARGPYDPDLTRLCVYVVASGSGKAVDALAGLVDSALSLMAGRGWGAPARAEVLYAGDVGEAGLDGCGYLMVFLATGGTEAAAVEMSGMAARARLPLLIASHPHANSLSSLLEVKALGLRAAFGHLRGGPESEAVLEAWVRGLWAAHRLSRARIGIIGEPSPWLVYSRPGGEARVGARLASVSAESFLREVEETRYDGELEGVASRLLDSAAGAELAPGEPAKSLRVYKALRAVVARRGLDAVTPACWWFYRRTGANACLAHALLNSEGVVVGCEGDVPATASMLLVAHASGSPAFFANVADVNGDRVLLAHCTPPLALARRYTLTRHFITGGSVTVRAELEEGIPWTIARVDASYTRLRVAVGKAVEGRPWRRLQCETQLLLEIPGAWRLVEDSIGNHYVAVPGDHRESLRVAGEALGLRVEVLGGRG